MKKVLAVTMASLAMVFTACSTGNKEPIHLRILHTSDVHGRVLDSLQRINTYVGLCRRDFGNDNIILTDGGDVLQGYPAAYYYNFVDSISCCPIFLCW